MEKLVIVCCLHGNERFGLDVCKSQSLFPFVLANEKALEENKRFIDADLNRVFPGNFQGNHEEKLAAELTENLKSFEYVLDLHSSSNECPLFGIITKPNEEKIEFAKKLGLKKLVIMSPSFASGKALIDFTNCGISLEVGPHERSENIDEVLELINNFAGGKNYNNDLEIFEVVSIVKKLGREILIKNFEPVFNGQVISQDTNFEQKAEYDFVPVLVGEKAYGDTLCLACKKISSENVYKSEKLNGNMIELLSDNEKLVKDFGAVPVSKLKKIPECYTFQNGLIYSHRDFDKFLAALEKGEKCAIVSGVNASGTLHLGHKVVFDTNLFFQKKYGIPVFIPISDDESYVSGKVESQEKALDFSLKLAKEMLAYGFDPKKTYFIIDQIYTNIYNLAIKLSKKINYSEIKATYGYSPDNNIGLHFYPSVQSAHILFPQEKFGIKNVLVPIGPDEDAHLRICRDIADRMGYNKPAVVHLKFLPGLDGEKMSKSRDNAIFLNDDLKIVVKKINKALSGGQKTIEEHRRLGGNPDSDMSFQYLKAFFLSESESDKLEKDYRAGKILSGEMKKLFSDKMVEELFKFQDKLKHIKDSDVEKALLKN
jgi:tryptophanyl-tRNA synthetase